MRIHHLNNSNYAPITAIGSHKWFFRVYIAKYFYYSYWPFHKFVCIEASVYSNQLIKLELLTQSIRQQKLPPHPAVHRHSTRLSVWPRLLPARRKSAAARVVVILLWINPNTIQLRRFILTIFGTGVNRVTDDLKRLFVKNTVFLIQHELNGASLIIREYAEKPQNEKFSVELSTGTW